MSKKIFLILFGILLVYTLAFAETYNLSLRAGENLISLPLIPQDTSITNILLPIISQVKDVWEFNPSDPNDPWKHYQPAMAGYSDLSQMDVGKGYWINVKSDVNLLITGTPVPPNYLLNLKTGWNVIGWPYQNTQDIAAALVALNFGTDYTQVSRLNSSTKAQENFLNQPTGDNFTAFEPGKAYYIYMLQNKTIQIGLSGPADTTPPTGTITINAGSQYTNATTVILTLTATDVGSGMGSGAQMRFSNDGLTWSTPEAYVTAKNWTLSSGDGTKVVYVKFKDAAGNWSQAYSDSIILDTSAPSAPEVTDDGVSTTKTTELHVRWSAVDETSGITEYQYKITQDSIYGTIIVDWTSTGNALSEVTRTGLNLTLNKTYYFSVKAKNGAGLWSSVGYSNGIKVVADTTAPAITGITPTDGSTFSENDSVLISATVNDTDDSPLEYQFSVDGVIKQAWSSLSSYAWTAKAGIHSLKIEVRDSGGNDSKEAEVYVFRKPLSPPN